jgi:CheY-like chemotaxis protein
VPTVLIVNDHLDAAKVLARIMRHSGYDAEFASSGAEALEFLQSKRPDAVVLDVMMPGMDGREVLRSIRADTRLHDLPVLMYSADQTQQTFEEARMLGANEYLVKGAMGFDDLVAMVKKKAIGSKATEKDGMVKFTIGRTVKMPCGCEVGKEMGVNTWAAFYGSDEHAFVDGDFAAFEGELQPVLKALRAHGINVVAIHSHMEGENPRVIFLHYWGVGPAGKLAQGVKAALDTQKGSKP